MKHHVWLAIIAASVICGCMPKVDCYEFKSDCDRMIRHTDEFAQWVKEAKPTSFNMDMVDLKRKSLKLELDLLELKMKSAKSQCVVEFQACEQNLQAAVARMS